MKPIDNLLNSITMYRLLLYFLSLLLLAAGVFSVMGILPFNLINLIISVLFIISICWATNLIFSKIYHAPTNIESVYISALILALIITPANSTTGFAFLFWASVWTMASKYIVAIGKKHIFNPVAFAVTLTSISINQAASWWIGTISMLPFVILGGLLIVKKIRRTDMVVYFFLAVSVILLISCALTSANLFTVIKQIAFDTPLLFFGFVMLTEPLTTPPTNILQSWYGVIVGILFSPQIHIGSLYTTPETALIIGNIFSYIVSPKTKLILKINQKIKIAPDIYDFIFDIDKKIIFNPGQYMEWTLTHNRPDSRGNRRYFTIASSPTENNIRIGIKFNELPSSFKKSLLSENIQNEIVASQLSGDFTLPKNPLQKCVFIAGGIGITPYRSMIKYLLDTNQKRSIILFYANRHATDIVYQDIFEQAQKNIGLKTIYILSDKKTIPPNWNGKIGHLDSQMIIDEIQDWHERIFYLSGPHSMVSEFKKTLINMDLNKNQIKTDYFPGLV
jgi:glycine betaine catabolism B